MGRPPSTTRTPSARRPTLKRRATRLELALGVGALERIRQLESELAATTGRADTATAANAALRQELAKWARDARRADERTQHLERLGAAIWAQLQSERSRRKLEDRASQDGLLGLNRAERRAAERHQRRHRAG